jgi:hypothetical protein
VTPRGRRPVSILQFAAWVPYVRKSSSYVVHNNMLSQHTEDNIRINQESCVVISPGSEYKQEVRHVIAYNMFHTTHRRMFMLEDETQAVENQG